ncbi:MAG TPA: helix-turn-helix domain-containing protein [Paracoccaceae bacterium]|nr:helix-turn-helix domain-containing protein [Paracoccaceae bacterium]
MLQKHCLDQKELARRWGISHRTLERWRYTDQGPAFLKLGGRVLYRRTDVEAFERSRLQRAVAIGGALASAGQAPRAC